MTEVTFLKRAAMTAAGLTVVALALDRAIPHDPIPVAPFGEPWLTMLGSLALWLAILAVSHVGRWLYLIVRRREPNLGE